MMLSPFVKFRVLRLMLLGLGYNDIVENKMHGEGTEPLPDNLEVRRTICLRALARLIAQKHLRTTNHETKSGSEDRSTEARSANGQDLS